MFICSKCGKCSLPREKPERTVVKTRQKTYRNGETVSTGWEIVKEADLCLECSGKKKEQVQKYQNEYKGKGPKNGKGTQKWKKGSDKFANKLKFEQK